MNQRNVYCSLCGVVIEPVRDAATVKQCLFWLSNVRAVYAKCGPDHVVVTGVGLVDRATLEHPLLLAPMDRRSAYFDDDRHLTRYSLCSDASAELIFPFHDACWQLTVSWIEIINTDEDFDQLARSLFDIFHSTPRDDGFILNPRHGYGGAQRLQQKFRSRFNYDPIYGHHSPQDELEEHFYSDPLVPFWKQQSELPALAGNILGERSSIQVAGATVDIFSRLPDELIIMTITHLSLQALCSLRLASRRVATITGPADLPQSFWASRFLRGRELEFAMAGLFVPRNTVDWKELYYAVVYQEWPPGLTNKWRIWQVLTNILPILQYDLNFLSDPYERSKSTLPGPAAGSLSAIGPVVCSEFIAGSQRAQTFQIAGRRLSTTNFPWVMLPDGEEFILGVSFYPTEDRWYVSGLRLVSCGSNDEMVTWQFAGRITPTSEQWLLDFNPSKLISITIAADLQGILGLEFISLANELENRQVVGDMDTSKRKVGLASLRNPANVPIAGIALGFSAFTVVSVQLLGQDVSLMSSEGTRTHDGPQAAERSPDYADLWTPHPFDGGKRISFEDQREPAFNLHLNVDFGGPGGMYLASLQRVTVFVHAELQLFIGFQFHYDNGRSTQFGRKTVSDSCGDHSVIHLSFLLDGPKGEMISVVDVFTLYNEILMAIEIRTNWGRSKRFGLPFLSAYGSAPVTLRPAKGDVITGFVGLLEKWTDTSALRSFEIATIPDHNASMMAPYPKFVQPTHVSAELIGPSILHQDSTFLTVASLQNIRRIRLSAGEQGCARSEEEISGLWIEYYDNNLAPEILGQWHKEIGCWEFQKNEMISFVSFTVSAEAEAESPDPLGKLIGIRMVSNVSAYEISTRGFHQAMELNFRENAYQTLDQIYWAVSGRHDHIRILFKPNTKGEKYPFVKLDGEQSWTVPERVFWTEQDHEGTERDLCSLEIHKDCLGVTGLAFDFQDNIRRSIGVLSGEFSKLELDEGESLNGFDVECNDFSRIISLSFWTTHGRTLRNGLSKEVLSSSSYLNSYQPPRYKCQPYFAVHDFGSGEQKFVGIAGYGANRGGPIRGLYPIVIEPLGVESSLPNIA